MLLQTRCPSRAADSSKGWTVDAQQPISDTEGDIGVDPAMDTLEAGGV